MSLGSDQTEEQLGEELAGAHLSSTRGTRIHGELLVRQTIYARRLAQAAEKAARAAHMAACYSALNGVYLFFILLAVLVWVFSPP